jgi:hypothetical protein
MATTKDHSLILRKGIVAHLRANAGLVALVPASSIYGEQPKAIPSWPFIRCGFMRVIPIRLDCYLGGEYPFTLHAFSKSNGTDEILTIRAAIIAAMDGASIDLANALNTGSAAVCLSRHDLSNLIPDGDEAGAYHDIHNFTVRVMEKTS